TIREIQDWTGIRFDKQLYQKNPLFYHDLKDRNSEHSVSFAPERIPVRGTDNIVSDSSHQRKKIEHLSIRKVIINSAMINPKGPQKSGEWISLHNRGNKKIKIDGWRLVDGQGRTGTLTGSIGSGESIKIKGKNKGKVMLSNSGGSMMLYDKENCLIDYVTWSKQQVRRTEKDVAFIFDNAS
ncbi:MAG TPA: lamin tail domain-containing protein, partial [Gammaproteobacteria bacterium]|nr:lamin tail domain-containing protein [Gammaproteobacteria bacterium]